MVRHETIDLSTKTVRSWRARVSKPFSYMRQSLKSFLCKCSRENRQLGGGHQDQISGESDLAFPTYLPHSVGRDNAPPSLFPGLQDHQPRTSHIPSMISRWKNQGNNRESLCAHDCIGRVRVHVAQSIIE